MFIRLIISGALLIAVTAPLYAQQDKRTWRLRTEAGQSMLTYGTDNAEDTEDAEDAEDTKGRSKKLMKIL